MGKRWRQNSKDIQMSIYTNICLHMVKTYQLQQPWDTLLIPAKLANRFTITTQNWWRCVETYTLQPARWQHKSLYSIWKATWIHMKQKPQSVASWTQRQFLGSQECSFLTWAVVRRVFALTAEWTVHVCFMCSSVSATKKLRKIYPLLLPTSHLVGTRSKEIQAKNFSVALSKKQNWKPSNYPPK